MIDIQTQQQLQSLCVELKKQPFFCLDTEFIREKTYFPVLALIQIAWPDQDPLVLDPCTLDLTPFMEVMQDPKVLKVLHAGRQDIEIFYNLDSKSIGPVFDTQVAAALLGMGEQIGYSALVQRVNQVVLGKGSRFTDWLARPLLREQLEYARDDVRYLSEIYKTLHSQLEKRDRLEWVEAEMERMYGAEQFTDNPEKLWMKVKKWNSLRPKDWPVLQKLAIWRWQTAVQADRPIRHILADESLVELARSAKLDEKQLANKRFIRPGWLKRYGKDVIEIHTKARALPKSEWPVVQRPPDYPSNVEQIAEFAYIRVLECARKHQLTPSWLISKKELLKAVNALLGGEDSGLEGWRKSLLEKELKPVLEGGLSLRVQGDKLVWVETSKS